VIIHAIRDQNGKQVGFVNGAIRLSKLSDVASEVTMHDGKGWICDGKGYIFTQNFNEILNVKNGEKYGYQGLEAVGEKMLSGQSGLENIRIPGGSKAMIFYEPIPCTERLSLGIIVSEGEITKDTHDLIGKIILFGFGMIVCAIVVSLIITDSIAKPIHKLKLLMEKAKRGNLDVRFDHPGEDEVGRLGESFNHMIVQIQHLLHMVYKEQISKRKAELAALQAQIKPHFLYNTLDTIYWMALDYNAFDVADMITALSDLFRISNSKGEEIITVHKEIEHIKSYLFIQKIRYDEQLEYDIRSDEQLGEYKVTKLILQPIVENAIYHGIKTRREKGEIRICVEKKEE
jgi:two-component system sensor histidine kinase YesM